MTNRHYVDPHWCRENPEEAAAQLAEKCQANDDLRSVIENLKRERTEYKEVAEHYVPQAQALAAHVGRLRGLGQLVREAATDMGRIGTEELFDRAEKWDAAMEDEPTTSLARLKAQWCEDKATHFITLASNARENGYMAQGDAVEDMAQELKDEAAKLRRQAEENSDEG